MIQTRNFVTILILNLVTCGIYGLYYMYTVTQDMNTMVGNDGHHIDPSIAVLLNVVTCGFYGWYWYYEQGNRMKALCDRNNIPCEENGTTYLIWMLIGGLVCGVASWIGMYLFIKNLNNLSAAYNRSMGAYQAPSDNGMNNM